MSRVLLCHCQAAEERVLRADDRSFVSCDDSEEMMAEVALEPPDVVVYEVRPESASDLAVLRLLRRVVPRIPFVVVGEGVSPAWAVPADLAPLYRAPLPVEAARLRDAVQSALAVHAAEAN